MAASLGGGYGEQRGSSNTSTFYDPQTYLSREQGFDWWQNPGTMPSFYTGGDVGADRFTSPDFGTTNAIVGQLQGLGTGLTPTEQSGVTAFQGATDLGALQSAERNNFGQIVTPQIRNALARTGQGRSGAEAEAIQRAGTEASVPLATLANQRQAELGQLISGLGAGGAERFLRALLGGGQMSLQGALGASGQRNQFNLGMQGQRAQFFRDLLNSFQPLKVREKGKTTGSNWNVRGSAGASFAPTPAA